MLTKNSFLSAESIIEAMNNAKVLQKQGNAINKGVQNLFKAGSISYINNVATDKEREKLHQFISNDGLSQQIQNQSDVSSQPQGFAEGGDVQAFRNSSTMKKTTPMNGAATTSNMTNMSSMNSPYKLNYTYYDNNMLNDGGVKQALQTPVSEGTDFYAEHYPELGMIALS